MSKYSSSDCPDGMIRFAQGELASCVSNSSLQKFEGAIDFSLWSSATVFSFFDFSGTDDPKPFSRILTTESLYDTILKECQANVDQHGRLIDMATTMGKILRRPFTLPPTSSNQSMKRGDALLRLIGNTPLIPLYFEAEQRTVWGKCEFLNPSGSIKDRLARTIILNAEERGLLHSDTTILECTSGNTGIAFAMVGAARGYRVSIVMSKRASGERRMIIRHFGAELILFDEPGYQAGIDMTHQMAAENVNYFLPRQFENELNAIDHEHETGPEILNDVPGPIDVFVTGYGTGGTLAGCSRSLKKARKETKIIAMEPAESALLAGEEACCHWIEGIAGGFVPPLLRGVEIDGTCKVSSPDAIAMTLRLNREFGLLVGSSSGANMAAALQHATSLPKEAVVVTILCDRAERYFSTRLFNSDC